MRHYVVAAALVAALAPVSASSAEDTCLIRVSQPYGRDDVIHVEGTMTCTSWFPGMAFTLCLESLKPASGTVGWGVEACSTSIADTGATSVSSAVSLCIARGPAVLRGTATGADKLGRPVSGFGAPTVALGQENCF